MGITPKVTREVFIEYLEKVINGMSYLELSKTAPYKVPFLSTKLRQIAREEGKEDLLNASLAKQKAKRNGRDSLSDESSKYNNFALLHSTEWRELKEYKGYFISNAGCIKKDGKLLKPSVSKRGLTKYARAILSKEGKRSSAQVHRLVLSTFLDEPESNKLQVDHINGNGIDNRLSNLRWVTGSENIQASFKLHTKVKLGICSKGGSIGSIVLKERAFNKYSELLGNRLISYNSNSTITYKCLKCGEEKTEPMTSRCFRHGANGICGSCRRLLKKESKNE